MFVSNFLLTEVDVHNIVTVCHAEAKINRDRLTQFVFVLTC